MKPLWHALALLALALPLHAAEIAPGDFAWTATVDAAPHQGLVRLPVPAQALARLQSPTAADLRVFDAKGQAAPFALATPPQAAQAPRAATPAVPALPLFSAAGAVPRGAVRVRVEDGSRSQALWVQLEPGAATAGTQRLPSALFDTRSLRGRIDGLRVQGRLPPNVPVRVTLSSSTDLANWTPHPVRGRLYRFDGPGTPSNETLELAEPLDLQGRYLRLDWSGQEGVAIEAITGLLAPPRPVPTGPSVPLPAPQADGPAARVWSLGFATPVAALDLVTPQPNTLVPVRILGRNQPSDAWRLLANTVVYRLGTRGQESVNAPVALPNMPVRWLRIEATHGARLEGLPLQAQAQFAPLEVVFVAGAGSQQLAAGRAHTPAAALPLAVLAGTTALSLESLPLARVTAVRETPVAPPPAWAAWLPAGADPRTVGLWLVLALGVALLGGVAFALLRQLQAQPPVNR